MSTPESSESSPFPAGVPGYLIVYFGALVALGPISMNSYIPAIPSIAATFGVDTVSVNYTLSVFLIGFAAGQYFGGAFSDQIGRKRIGSIGLGLYIATTLAITAATAVEQMYLLRFVQAIGGGFSTVICMATVRDVYPISELGRRFATITAIMLVAPLVAPTLGSVLLGFGWEFIFFFKASYATLLFGLYLILVPETVEGRWRAISLRAVWSSFIDVLSRRVDGRLVPLRLALLIALGSSVLMNFVTNAATVYLEHFGISPSAFPLYFALTVAGFMAVNLYSMRHLRPANATRLLRRALWTQLSAALVFLVLVLAGVDTLAVLLPPLIILVAMLGIIGPAGSSIYMSHFTKLAGSAASAYTTLMFIAGGSFGALTGALYDGSLLPLGLTMAAASLAANAIAVTVPSLRAEAASS